jgi:hypothetical protein
MKQCRKIPPKTVTCICPIVKNPKACNSGTIGVTMIKCELDVQLNSGEPHGKFQFPI